MSGGPLLRWYPDGSERVVGVVHAFPTAAGSRRAIAGEVICRRIGDLRDVFPAVAVALQETAPEPGATAEDAHASYAAHRDPLETVHTAPDRVAQAEPPVRRKVRTRPLQEVWSRLKRSGRHRPAVVALIGVITVSVAIVGIYRLNSDAQAAPPTAAPSPSLTSSPAPVECPTKTRTKAVQIFTIPQRTAVFTVAFSPDQYTLATGSDNTQLRDVTDPARPGIPVLADKTGSISALAFSPNGHIMATANTEPRSLITLWNVDDPRHPIRLATRPGPENRIVHSIAFSQDGHTMATADSAAGVVVWNVTKPTHPTVTRTYTYTAINPVTDLEEPVAMFAVAFNPAQPVLAVGGADNKITIYDLANPTRPTVVATVPSPDWVYTLAFSRAGSTLVSGGRSRDIQVWDMANPAAPRTEAVLESPKGGIQAIAIRPDEHVLATANLDHSTTIWGISDPRNPVCIETLHTSDDGIVYTVAFSHDGGTMATGDRDHYATLWSVGPNG